MAMSATTPRSSTHLLKRGLRYRRRGGGSGGSGGCSKLNIATGSGPGVLSPKALKALEPASAGSPKFAARFPTLPTAEMPRLPTAPTALPKTPKSGCTGNTTRPWTFNGVTFVPRRTDERTRAHPRFGTGTAAARIMAGQGRKPPRGEQLRTHAKRSADCENRTGHSTRSASRGLWAAMAAATSGAVSSNEGHRGSG